MTINTSKFSTWKQWKRDALRMHYQGKAHQEIADALDKPYFTITTHLRRHRESYPKEYVSQYYGDLENPERKSDLFTPATVYKRSTVPSEAMCAPYGTTKKPTIFVIGDTQCKQGIDNTYMHWIGAYIARKKPDIIVHIGDHYDMASLSTYDKGQLSAEGRRVRADIAAGDEGLDILEQYIQSVPNYSPRKVVTLGNHEERIDRYVSTHPELHGFMGTEFLAFSKYGWEVQPFLKPIDICGINFVHYLANPMTGKPFGGTALNRLKNVGESYVMGHQQVFDYAERPLQLSGRKQLGMIVGACLTPDHKVLHTDLTYRPLGDIKVGDELVSFDEQLDGRKARRYKRGTVLNTRKVPKVVYAVTLTSGKVFKVTGDHLWVTKGVGGYNWRATDNLRKGMRVPKFLDEWEQDMSYEAGWLSGMYDGEGCYSVRETSAGYVGQLQMSQKEGLVQERYKQTIKSVFNNVILTSTAVKRDVVQSRVQGGVRTIAKVLGTLRPTRLLPKFSPEHLGRLQCSSDQLDTVEDIKLLGEREVVMVEVDAGTMIVEGYAHHNCYDHDEGYKGYQGNHHFRGCVMLYECSDGYALHKNITLQHMKELYEGSV